MNSSFDWRLVAQRRWLRPWMLAGGLTPENVAQAIRLTNARQVDVVRVKASQRHDFFDLDDHCIFRSLAMLG